MGQFSDIKPRFAKACGGNVKIELLETGSNGEVKVLFAVFMPRAVFFEAYADGGKFIAELQREEAEASILTLPRGRKRAKG